MVRNLSSTTKIRMSNSQWLSSGLSLRKSLRMRWAALQWSPNFVNHHLWTASYSEADWLSEANRYAPTQIFIRGQRKRKINRCLCQTSTGICSASVIQLRHNSFEETQRHSTLFTRMSMAINAGCRSKRNNNFDWHERHMWHRNHHWPGSCSLNNCLMSICDFSFSSHCFLSFIWIIFFLFSPLLCVELGTWNCNCICVDTAQHVRRHECQVMTTITI